MRHTQTTRDLRAVAGRALLGLLAAFAALLTLASTASAQSAKPGPAVTGGTFTDAGLVLKGQPNAAVPFSGDVTLASTRGAAEWTPFDRKAVVKRGGAQLLQKGGVGGIPVEEFFAEGQPRRILIRNGDGATTELDVVRAGTGLVVARANRAPARKVRERGLDYATKTVDALADGDVSIQLERGTLFATGYDVVLGTTIAPLPDGVTNAYTALYARNTDTGTLYVGSQALYEGGSSVSFFHLTLPEGSYDIALQGTLSFGNPLVSTTNALVSYDVPPIRVSTESRIFGVELPAPDLPPLADVAVTVDGLAGLEPSFSNRYDVVVTLSSVDGRSQASASRNVGDPGPVMVPLRLPAGRYNASVNVYQDDSDPNGKSFSAAFPLGSHDVPGDVAVSIPPLVRMTGALIDPGFALASGSASGGTPTHWVTASDPTGGGGFSASVTLRGFARGYQLYVPRGSSIQLSASLTVAIGRPIDGYTPWENDSGGLSLRPAGGVVACGDGCAADVTVPELGDYVTLSGTALDRHGKPAPLTVVYAALSGVGGDAGASFGTVVLTDGKGEFRLRLPRGRGYQLTASRPF